jgi:hypothetical protein
MKRLGVLVVAAMAVACGGGSSTTGGGVAGVSAPIPAAETAKTPETTPPPAVPAPPAEKEVTVGSGTALSLDLATALTTETAKVEDPVKATVRKAVVVGGDTVIPVGAELTGVVTGVARPGRVKGLAKLSYRFDKMRVNGETYTIKTSPIGHTGEASKKADATKIGIGAGAGAVLGGILGGGGGAAKGAAIGGGAGTGVVLATRGKDLTLAPGANVATKLTAPVTVKVKA